MGGEEEKGARREMGTGEGYSYTKSQEEGRIRKGGGDGLESNPAGSRSCSPCQTLTSEQGVRPQPQLLKP